MKRIKYNSGGQPFYNSDFALQQTEIFKAIENQFLDTSGLVLSGCVVTGNSISSGLVYLDGKVRELAAATGLTFPCYIRAAAQIDYDSRIHTEDNQNKTTKSEFKAEIVNSIPAGNYITVTANGVDKRLQYVVKSDQNGQFTPTGFQLNTGKVSYVEASRTTNQTLSSGDNFVNFTTVVDDLNEFDSSSGEFTANQAGLYLFNFSGRIDIPSTAGFEFEFQYFNGSSWVRIANTLRNIAEIQGSESVSCVKKLSAGEKVRLRVYAVGSGYGPLQWAHLSIARIG